MEYAFDMNTTLPHNLWTLGKLAETFRISYARLAELALRGGVQPRWTLNGLAYYQDEDVDELRRLVDDDQPVMAAGTDEVSS